MTASELCSNALVFLGVIGAGQTATSEDMNLAFLCLNNMLDGWSLDDLMVFCESDETFTLTGAQGTYTVGPSGDFDTVRPTGIQRAWIRLNDVDYVVKEINNEEYNSLSLKTMETTLPQYYYYNPTYPQGTLKLWPVPSTSMTMDITSTLQFTRFANLTTSVSLPPGYSRALLFNLIVEIAEAWGTSIEPSIKQKASASKEDLKKVNSPMLRMSFDSAILGRNGRYNIYTDQWR